MNAGDIAFPNLGIYLKDVPKTFSIFGFEIAFYGLLIGIGVLAGILMAAHMAKVTGQNPDEYWDFAILLKADDSGREADHVLLLVFDFPEILGLELQYLRHAFTSIGS